MANENEWKLDEQSILDRVGSGIVRQEEFEARAKEKGIELYRKNLKDRGVGNSTVGNILISKTLVKMVDGFKVWLELPARGQNGAMKNWFKDYVLSPEQVCFIAMTGVLNGLRKYTVQDVAKTIGKQVLDAGEYQKFKKQSGGLFKTIKENVSSSTARHKHRVLMGAKRKIAEIPDELMTDEETIKLGMKLIMQMIESTGLIALENDLKIVGAKASRTYIQPSEELTSFLDEMNELMEVRKPYNMPTVIPPRPWTTLFDGGYWFSPRTRENGLIKGSSGEQLKVLVKHDWTQVFEQVNIIQATPWRVNKSVLGIMKQCMEFKDLFAKIPSCELKEIPKAWGNLPDEEWYKFKEDNPEASKEWKFKQAREHDKFNRGISKRDAIFRALAIAEEYKDEEEFYLPHTLDSRGRCYPATIGLNPQVGDFAQGLIELKEGKPLGVDGLRWLLIDLANTYGFDKATLDERVVWALDNEAMIMECASAPMTDRRWAEADKPFNFLARCIALAEAKNLSDPTEYVCHLGGQLDGSNNGCQHLGALMKDEKTCEAVNVLPSDSPKDVYQLVADSTAKLVEEDMQSQASFNISSSNSKRLSDLALVWYKKMDRSLVKQPTMTTPYGVTMRGIDQQLKDFLKKYRAEKGRDFTQMTGSVDEHEATTYLADRVDTAIGQEMSATKEAMGFMQRVAHHVSTESGEMIHWVTPNGFLAVQEYRKQKGRRITVQTGGQTSQVKITVNKDTENINPQKMLSGIAPNVVHSFDACHMLLTVKRCWDKNISSFSLIHDSYGVHHSDITNMRNILREEFVGMYAETNLLADWRDQVAEQFPAISIEEAPKQGEANISKVLGSEYFFA